MMASPSGSIASFGVFEVDQQAGELRKSGIRIRIQEQPFRILTVLLDHPGEVVTREELRQILWPDDTFVDFEHSLNAAVNKLREVLGDSAGNPRFVETVPRRGYRFIYPIQVQHSEARGPTVGGSGAVTAPSHDRGRGRWIGIGAAVLLAVVATVAVALQLTRGLKRSSPSEPNTPLTSVPLTSFPGSEMSPTFSPDGSQIAFSWDGNNQDNFDIYVTVRGGAEPHRLTDSPKEDYAPAWSPDGLWIAFLRQGSSGESEIRLISPLGGSETRLGQVVVGNEFGNPQADRFLAWSPDGKWLAVQDQTANEKRFHLSLLSLESGETRQLTRPDGPFGDFSPAFSPDGRSITYYSDLGLLVLALDEGLRPLGEPRALPSDGRGQTGPIFSADGERVIYSSGTEGDQPNLWEVAASGSSAPRPLAFVGQGGILPSVSRQGNRLAYSQVTYEWSIRRIERRDRGVYSAPMPVIESTRVKMDPRLSPDGGKIAFASTRSGRPEIWVANSDGSEPHRVTSFPGGDLGSPSWSPDGKTIAFDGFDGNQSEIFTVAADGGPHKPVTTHPSINIRPSWSRDGRWIYFSSMRSGEDQVWKVPFSGGSAEQVTGAGGWDPIESHDGKFVYYLKKDGTLWRIPAAGGEEAQVCDSCRVYSLSETLAVVEGGIYFLNLHVEPDGRVSIRYLDLATGQVELVAKINKPVPSGLSASVDGRTIVYSQLNQSNADVFLVENFR